MSFISNPNLSFITFATVAGVFTIFIDIVVRQHLLEKTIEKKKLPEVCVQYRRSFEHYLSLFITGVLVFILVHKLHFRLLQEIA
jgi:hypothetical protein